jgi:glutathione S-transferase
VPTLTVDTDVVTQNVAILSYLAQRAPEKKLLPSDPLQRAQAVSQMSFLSSTVHPAFGRWFRPERVIADKDAGAAVKGAAKDAIAGYFQAIDAHLAGRDYAVGDDFGVVDAYLHVFYRWGSRIELDMVGFKNYAAHGKRVAARPAVGRALADEGVA